LRTAYRTPAGPLTRLRRGGQMSITNRTICGIVSSAARCHLSPLGNKVGAHDMSFGSADTSWLGA